MPLETPSLSRRTLLLAGAGTAVLAAAASIEEATFGYGKRLVSTLRADTPEKTPFEPYGPYAELANKMGEFPSQSPLQDRLLPAVTNGTMVMNYVAGHQTDIIADSVSYSKLFDRPEPWHFRQGQRDAWRHQADELKRQKIELLIGTGAKFGPYPTGPAEAGVVNTWANLAVHVSQSDVPNAHDIAEQVLAYLYTKSTGPHARFDFHDDIESHVMSLIAELMETHAGDERLDFLVTARHLAGITQKSGSHDKPVPHDPLDAENPLPPTGELSWMMLVAARLGVDYQDDSRFTLVDAKNNSHPVSPARLAQVALHYCKTITSDSGDENYFVEHGCHVVHGVLVLLGKYSKDIQQADQALYENLQQALYKAIRSILERASVGENRETKMHLIGGHLLQSILDPDAANIFEMDGSWLNAADVIGTQSEKILATTQEEFEPKCHHEDTRSQTIKENLKSVGNWYLCKTETGGVPALASGRVVLTQEDVQWAMEQLKTIPDDTLEKMFKKRPGETTLPSRRLAQSDDRLERVLGNMTFANSFIPDADANQNMQKGEHSPLDVVRWICSAAATDVRPTLLGKQDTAGLKNPTGIPFVVGHSLAGLKKLDQIISAVR